MSNVNNINVKEKNKALFYNILVRALTCCSALNGDVTGFVGDVASNCIPWIALDFVWEAVKVTPFNKKSTI